jgi:hypothetical protein
MCFRRPRPSRYDFRSVKGGGGGGGGGAGVNDIADVLFSGAIWSLKNYLTSTRIKLKSVVQQKVGVCI